jgi:hypothetical protein
MTDVAAIPKLQHCEAMVLAADEFARTLDFCWTLAGRLPGAGLLTTPVPF